jgi:mono/diheme cytochrome c family protein
MLPLKFWRNLFFIGGVFLTSPLFADQALLEKGQRIYLTQCTSCHNRDPNKKGGVGPELIDAPLEVMQIKVVTGRYPEKLPAGFTPKRSTKAMKASPALKNDVSAIYDYIQSVKNKK